MTSAIRTEASGRQAGNIDERRHAVRDATTRDIVEESVPAPAAFPGAAIAGGILGVALLALCGVLIRDVLVETGVVDGESLTYRAATNLAELTWEPWMWVIPVLCGVVGIGALWLAGKPRRRTHVQLVDHPVVWTRAVDVARRVSAAVADLPDVRHAVTVVGRRRIRVLATVSLDAVDRDRIARVAADAAGPVGTGKRVVVKVRGPKEVAR